MKIPKPEEGLVINYSYLWHNEAARGAEEGRKDRPCAVVLASHGDRVAVAPITHTPPEGGKGIEIPHQIKKQIGLDDQRSWLITNEINHFKWPGTDLRPKDREGQTVYGKMPPSLTKSAKQRIAHNARNRTLKQVNRDDDQQQKPEKDRPRPRASETMKKQREQSKKRKR